MGGIQIEEWKEIINYPNYEISNYGNVRSKDRYVIRNGRKSFVKGQMLKQFMAKGYMRVALYNGDRCSRKQFQVHVLVAKHFIPNPNDFPIVNHKDENKQNNKWDNLEWCTKKYNANYGTCIKRRVEHQDWNEIAAKQSKEVLQYDLNMNLVREWKSTADCSRNGFNGASISKCCNGKLKTYKKFIWRYK